MNYPIFTIFVCLYACDQIGISFLDIIDEKMYRL